MEHPHGLPPPEEWFAKGRVGAAEFRKWLESTTPARSHKFNAKVGYYADLGHSLKSLLEADCERLLRFLGYAPCTEPPGTGKFYRYEGTEYLLATRRGKTVGYKPDFHLWADGTHSLWEAKGCLDARSKRALSLMAAQHPELPITLITREELEARKAEALYAARRRGEHVLDVPHWGEGPQKRP